MKIRTEARTGLLICTALASVGFLPVQAMAQAANASAQDNGTKLEEIVVTAQKREQNLQDVPIAVTALTQNTLVANRIATVSDLSGMAPGVTVRTAAGGSALPSFSVRGAISYGVVPGSDKEVSVYIDGVYISAARGAIFDLPDIERIEMLRGPQGTLFGRNATAGAVSITTRDPDGKFGITATQSIGNYNMNRERLSVDTPQFGPFSAYFSIMHSYKRGDIQNAASGLSWDRTAGGGSVQRSAEWLGTKNSTSYFAAIKFQPSSNFKMVYKYDQNDEQGTPEGTGLVGVNNILSGPNGVIGTTTQTLLAPLVLAVVNNQATPVLSAPSGQRPDIVDNGFAVPSVQKAYGQSLTTTWHALDNLTFKNIMAFRHSGQTNSDPIDGFSSLPYTQAADTAFRNYLTGYFGSFLPSAYVPGAVAGTVAGFGLHVGAPFVGIGTQPQSASNQWSDELQANYNSKLMALTVGAMWFHSRERSGYVGLPDSVGFTTVPGGVITGAEGTNRNGATSLAAYAQLELHVTSQLDLVGGIRDTQDKKTGSLVYGTPGNLTNVIYPVYKKTKPNFLIGANFKVTPDILLYGKYSTSFVSGGNVSTLTFAPEEAKSWEAGIKADLLDRRLRANLALYSVTYTNVQDASLASSIYAGDPALFPAFNAQTINSLGTVIISQGGPIKAKGFELELTAAPMRGVTLGGNISYCDTKFYDVNPVLTAAVGGELDPALRAPWNAAVWGQYVTKPVVGDSTISMRIDATWHDRFWQTQDRQLNIPAFAGINTVAPSWNANARIALRDIPVGNAKGEFALWAKNFTQNREATFALEELNLLGSANYVPARTFGADLTIKY